MNEQITVVARSLLPVHEKSTRWTSSRPPVRPYAEAAKTRRIAGALSRVANPLGDANG
jgi:hypothetical protein